MSERPPPPGFRGIDKETGTGVPGGIPDPYGEETVVVAADRLDALEAVAEAARVAVEVLDRLGVEARTDDIGPMLTVRSSFSSGMVPISLADYERFTGVRRAVRVALDALDGEG